MADKDTKKSLSKEIASRQRAEFVINGLGMSLPNPDPVLKKLGRDITVYRDILADPAVKGATRRRRSAVVSLEDGLEQGDASDRVYALCEQVLSRISLKTLKRGLHDAAWYGYSPAEIMWEKANGLWLPRDVIAKPPEWFAFNADNELCFKEAGCALSLEPVPAHKFITATNDATYANPYGIPDLASVYWAAVFKKGGLKFWLRFADKYGQAFMIGKHPRGTPDKEVDAILDALQTLAQDGVGAIPNDGSIDIIEAAGKAGSTDLFERLLMYCRSEINIALLGQNQGTETNSTNASAQAAIEVTEDIRDADADFISDAINELLHSVVTLNVGADEALPVFHLYEETDETERLSLRDERLAKAGANFTAQHFVDTYDDIEDAHVTDVIPQAAANAPLAFSEIRPLPADYAQANSQRLAQQAQPIVDDWIDEIRGLARTANDLPELQDMLVHRFSELPPDELTKVLQLGFLAAELGGMAQVADEAGTLQAGE